MESWVDFSEKEGHTNIQSSMKSGIEPGTRDLTTAPPPPRKVGAVDSLRCLVPKAACSCHPSPVYTNWRLWCDFWVPCSGPPHMSVGKKPQTVKNWAQVRRKFQLDQIQVASINWIEECLQIRCDSGCASFWRDVHTVRMWARNLRAKIRKCVPTIRSRETNGAFQKHLYQQSNDRAKHWNVRKRCALSFHDTRVPSAIVYLV